MHELGPDPTFNESMYFNVTDPGSLTAGFFRLGNRANEGRGEMTVCLSLPDGRVAFMFQHPSVTTNDAFDAAGMRFEVVEPFTTVRVTYDGPVLVLDDPMVLADPGNAFRHAPRASCRVDLDYSGLAPAFGGEPDRPTEAPGEEFARGHYEQLVAADGEISVGDDRFEVHGFGLRDHSWGPRSWQAPWYYRWLTANFGPELGFMGSRIARRHGGGIRGGFVWQDGRLQPCDGFTIRSTWEGSDRHHSAIEAELRAGARAWRVHGEVLRLVPLRNRRTDADGSELVTRISEGFTRWTLEDGTVGYGLSEYLDQIVDGGPRRPRRVGAAAGAAPARPPFAAMDRATVDVYEERGLDWARRRRPVRQGDARRFGREMPEGRLRLDAGCGAGRYTADLGRPVVGLDAARTMLEHCRAVAPGTLVVQGDLEALPFGPRALGGAWANMSYLHVARTGLPLALADLHRALDVGAPLDIQVLHGDYEGHALPDDDVGGRFFAAWRPEDIDDVLMGAGFGVSSVTVDDDVVRARAARARSLPDVVGPGMSMLVVGLNPSLYAADAGVGFARPGNRFWPAALAAGLVTRDRDPRHALVTHGVGMTDLVKRATVGAAELTRDEYRHGLARVERLVTWLQPGVVCAVGLAGWRAAADPDASAGLQPGPFGGRPLYLMPSTSGANAHSRPDELAAHLRAAAAVATSLVNPSIRRDSGKPNYPDASMPDRVR